MPKISIITPTKDRQNLLPVLWEFCLKTQSNWDFEWLIHDSSPQACTFDAMNDPRVFYTHAASDMTIGAKRNFLCNAAKSDIIAHFDDDDFYAPHYIERMLSFMDAEKADFVKLFGFFLYQRMPKTFAYYNLETDFPVHFRFASLAQPLPQMNAGVGMSGKWGYGFTFIFHRKVWEAIKFPDQNHGEDQIFIEAAIAGSKFKVNGKQDFDRSCLHIIHARNTSITFPQQILPIESLLLLFPTFREPL